MELLSRMESTILHKELLQEPTQKTYVQAVCVILQYRAFPHILITLLAVSHNKLSTTANSKPYKFDLLLFHACNFSFLSLFYLVT
jgi:hypothetical protein